MSKLSKYIASITGSETRRVDSGSDGRLDPRTLPILSRLVSQHSCSLHRPQATARTADVPLEFVACMHEDVSRKKKQPRASREYCDSSGVFVRA